MCGRLVALAACLELASACANRPQVELRLLALTPSQGTAAAPLDVEIIGQGLEPRLETNFQNSGESVLDATFRATLTHSRDGTAVELLDVTFTDQRTLKARIPDGLTAGLYDLTVADPSGRSALLQDAFRVITPADAVAIFRFDFVSTQREGIPFPLTLTAVDDAGETVDGFAGTVSLTDLTGTATPATLGPFTLGRFQGQVAVGQVTASDRLSATDELGHGGSSESFDVLPGPVVQVAFASAPVAVAAGDCSPEIVLELRDAFGTASPAEATVTIGLQGSAAADFFPGGGCTTPIAAVTVAPGTTQASFRFKCGSPPDLTVRALPDELPSVQQTETVQ